MPVTYLDLREGESLTVGGVTVKAVRVQPRDPGRKVRLGFVAPKGVRIDREEIRAAKDAARP